MKALGIFFLTIMISIDVIVLILSTKVIIGLIPYGINAIIPVFCIIPAMCIVLGLTELVIRDIRND